MKDKLEIYDSLTACPSCGCLDSKGSSRCPECGCFHTRIEIKDEKTIRNAIATQPPKPKDPSHYSLNPETEIMPDEDDEEINIDEDVTKAWSGGVTDFSNIE